MIIVLLMVSIIHSRPYKGIVCNHPNDKRIVEFLNPAILRENKPTEIKIDGKEHTVKVLYRHKTRLHDFVCIRLRYDTLMVRIKIDPNW